MAEWPVTLIAELGDVQRGQVPPGEHVAAMWANVSGDPRAAIWIVCPRCGTLGHCPTQASAEGRSSGGGWTVEAEGEKLTMRPSILCNSMVGLNAEGKVKRMDAPCGGHYFLTDGVLREV